MAAGLLENTMPQPIDDCLKLLGRLLCGGQGHGAVMSSHWVPPDLLGSSDAVGGKGLLESVLGVLGLQAGSVSDTDTLPSLGMDSMQLVEVCLPDTGSTLPQVWASVLELFYIHSQKVRCF